MISSLARLALIGQGVAAYEARYILNDLIGRRGAHFQTSHRLPLLNKAGFETTSLLLSR
jgi:hypothetical protein